MKKGASGVWTLTEAFKKESDRQLFFPIDGHPNAEGYKITANVIQKYLSQNNLLN